MIPTTTLLQVVHSFLMCLTNADVDGRILVERNTTPATATTPAQMRFVMMNPSVHFKEVIRNPANSKPMCVTPARGPYKSVNSSPTSRFLLLRYFLWAIPELILHNFTGVALNKRACLG